MTKTIRRKHGRAKRTKITKRNYRRVTRKSTHKKRRTKRRNTGGADALTAAYESARRTFHQGRPFSVQAGRQKTDIDGAPSKGKCLPSEAVTDSDLERFLRDCADKSARGEHYCPSKRNKIGKRRCKWYGPGEAEGRLGAIKQVITDHKRSEGETEQMLEAQQRAEKTVEQELAAQGRGGTRYNRQEVAKKEKEDFMEMWMSGPEGREILITRTVNKPPYLWSQNMPLYRDKKKKQQIDSMNYVEEVRTELNELDTKLADVDALLDTGWEKRDTDLKSKQNELKAGIREKGEEFYAMMKRAASHYHSGDPNYTEKVKVRGMELNAKADAEAAKTSSRKRSLKGKHRPNPQNVPNVGKGRGATSAAARDGAGAGVGVEGG